MRLKAYFTLIIVAFICSNSFAQRNVVKNLPTYDKKKIHFGFTIGTNFLNFQTEHSGQVFTDANTGEQYTLYTDLNNLSPGFNVGLVSSLRLGEYFNLRAQPGISFGQRDMQFIRLNNNTNTSELEMTIPVKSTFIELPILFKYKAVRDGNARPYLLAGGTARYDLARSKREDVVLKPMDFYLDLGVGSDFYFTYFRFGLEARISIGMMDMLWHDRPAGDFDERYIQSIDKMKSFLFILALNFE